MQPEPTAPTAARIENDSISVEYLLDAGPRIVGLYLKGSDRNLMGTAPSTDLVTPFGSFIAHGGHRLWHAPEAFPRSYIPDNSGLVVEKGPGRVSLIGAVEPGTMVQKTIIIELPEHGCHMTLHHRLQNHQLWPIELAPWALTMLPVGSGVAILPDQLADTPKDGLLPDRHWSLWPYSELKDSRFEPHNDLILVRAEPRENPFKFGYANKTGWVAFYDQGVLLVKRFDPQPNSPHPDFGCNAESYVKTEFLELETLGPLTMLEPGQTVEHIEMWQLYPGLTAEPTIDSLRSMIRALGLHNQAAA